MTIRHIGSIRLGLVAGWTSFNNRVRHPYVAIHKPMRKGTVASMKTEDLQNASTRLGMTPVRKTSTEATGLRRASWEDHIDKRVDEKMREVQGYISGIRLPDPHRICLLLEFCYLLELHQQVVDLSARLDRIKIELDWLQRVDAIVRASKMKL